MAFTPCALHQRMYKGGASTFFIAVVNGIQRRSRRLQTCPDCATVELDTLAQHLQKVSEGDDFYEVEEKTDCVMDGVPLDGQTWTMFVTAYPRGKPEQQWYGRLCPICADGVTRQYALS